MHVKDHEVIRLIERLSEHYRSNISNRYIRPALQHLTLDNQSWDLIEKLTERTEGYSYQGDHLDELYRQIAAAARFTALARKDLAPTLRLHLSSGPGTEKILREMAVNNFLSNLKIFSDLLNELYLKLVALDKEDSTGRVPLYLQMPELNDIGRLLVG